MRSTADAPFAAFPTDRIVSGPPVAEDSGFELLPWDSERFGFGVARVRASVMPE